MKLVLVSCCAPCSSGAIKQLSDGQIENISDAVVLFYNPNIYPQQEYNKRLEEQIKYCESLNVKWATTDYNHKAWLDDVKGLEAEPERGARCTKCFEHRFLFAEKWAIENGYNAITSVLGVSRHKSQKQVDDAAEAVLSKIKYLPVSWDNELKISIEKNTDFYRQKYCGCEFSIRKPKLDHH